MSTSSSVTPSAEGANLPPYAASVLRLWCRADCWWAEPEVIKPTLIQQNHVCLDVNDIREQWT